MMTATETLIAKKAKGDPQQALKNDAYWVLNTEAALNN